MLALLLAVGSGSGFAAGDLFDDDYKDCPHRTRLRDGQIADLSVNRDADEADEVNVSWAATDPATWGLGPNTFDASLVLFLDDGEGDPVSQSLSLGTRKVTFDGVDTGTEVTVQLAIVVDTAEGDYLISDILEARVHQSLSAPAFKGQVRRGTSNNEAGHPTGGTYYYIGYSEPFWNFRNAPGGGNMPTRPVTERLRIGLAHGSESSDDRDDVDFDAYVLRITDGDGDVVPEGDDVPTVDADSTPTPLPVRLFDPAQPNYGQQVIFVGTISTNTVPNLDASELWSNVRVNDGGTVRHRVWNTCAAQACTGPDVPTGFTSRRLVPNNMSLNANDVFPMSYRGGTTLWVHYPDAFRDFPTDTLASDETYTITAWAVNEDGEVLSPVESLRVHPVVRTTTFSGGLTTYLGVFANVGSLILTEFTVLE
ncbi:MAG: hypothetical protein F4Z18_10110 [Caldilineaceae bacterium SB0666_bin_21]|nr:hypothetical protein [Caldilineaceae bacterium SB0666_bin_21]